MTSNRGMAEELASSLEPGLAAAFLAAWDQARVRVGIRELSSALFDQNVDEVIRLLRLDDSYLWPLKEALRGTFNRAGVATVEAFKVGGAAARGYRFEARWNGDNPRAAYWAATRSSTFVTEIIEDQKLGLREHLLQAFEKKTPPEKLARELAGHVNRSTGRREGGLIGLRSDQMAFSRRVREALSGGTPDWTYYSGLKSRNAGLDAMVRQAWEAGRPLKATQVDKVMTALENRLLKQRADMIARTETMAAVHRAQYEAMAQQIEDGILPRDAVTKVWSATMDNRTRHSHAALNGVEKPFFEPFISPSTGAAMMHPSDREMGAAGEDTIQCRCFMHIRVDWMAGLRRRAA